MDFLDLIWSNYLNFLDGKVKAVRHRALVARLWTTRYINAGCSTPVAIQSSIWVPLGEWVNTNDTAKWWVNIYIYRCIICSNLKFPKVDFGHCLGVLNDGYICIYIYIYICVYIYIYIYTQYTFNYTCAYPYIITSVDYEDVQSSWW